jgi:hypothetical protein
MHIQTSYVSQMQSEMLRLLPTRGRREKDGFAALTVDEQAWRFMNWLARLVHPHPRQVAIAQGFDELPAVQSNRRDVDALLTKISRGCDLNARLSDDVNEGYCSHPPGKKHGPDFDMLLNEWGIHHLHLSSEPGKQGFNKRTKELLYVIFGLRAAFVLAVSSHGAWTSRRLIEAAIRSWPQQKLFVPLNVHPGRDPTENEHKALRKAGANTASLVGEQLWISAVTCGISTALVSLRTSQEACRVLRCVCQADEHPEHLTRQLMEAAAINGLTWPVCPTVHVHCFRGPDRYCFGFIEEASGTVLLI